MKSRAGIIVVLVIMLGLGGFTFRTIQKKRAKESAIAHFSNSDNLQKQGKIEDSIREMQLAIKDDPEYQEARVGLADLFQSINRVPEALSTLEEGIQQDPKNKPQYLSALCDIYRQENDFPKAIDYMRQSLALAPESMAGRRQLAMMLESAKQWDDAEREWQDFQKRYPNETSGSRGIDRVKRKRLEGTTPSATAKDKKTGGAAKQALTPP